MNALAAGAYAPAAKPLFNEAYLRAKYGQKEKHQVTTE